VIVNLGVEAGAVDIRGGSEGWITFVKTVVATTSQCQPELHT
jgi:hypothetical protein